MKTTRLIGALATKQALIAALLGLVLGLAFGVVQASYDYRESVREEQREIDQLLATVHEAATQACYNLNASAAAGVVKGVLSFAPVREVMLRNDFGETLASGRNDRVAVDVDAWWTAFVVPTIDYTLSLDYGPTHRHVGDLRVQITQAPRVERYLRGVGRAALLSVARSVFAALLLVALFYGTLTRPLASIARRIHDGTGQADAAPLAEAARSDEIGEIAAAFQRYEHEARERTLSLEASTAELAASEARYRRIVDTAGEGVWQVDAQGRTTFANDAIAHMLRTTPGLLTGRPMADSVDPAEAPQLARALRQRSGGDRPWQQLRFVRSDASIMRAELSVCPISDADGDYDGALVMVTDATERLHQEDELRATNERLRAMVEELERHKHDMAEITELNEMLQSARTEQEAIDVISAVAQRLFGDRSGGLSMASDSDGHNGGDMVRVGAWGEHPWVPERYSREDCWAIRRGRPHEQSVRRGLRCAHHPCDHVSSTLCAPLYVEDELLAVLHVGDGADRAPDTVFDEALRQRVQVFGEVVKLGLSNLRLREHLREQAVRDALTGLPNRRMFDETLPRELARCARAGQVLTVAVIDVDHFKHFNDSYGHKVGDRVLQAVAATLTHSVRAGDLCCRYGGDEFLCLLVGMSAAETRARFEQVQAELAAGRDASADGLPERVTFTVGVASATGPDTDAATLMQAADAALYTAKARGRNCVEVAATVGV